MRTVITDIAYYLPPTVITNQDLQSENPTWDIRRLQQHCGVLRRYIAGETETALDLACAACEKLTAKRPKWRSQIDGIIFCTQSPDYIMPPNACVLHQRLALADHVLAFDINLACSGFIYGLAIASALLQAKSVKGIILVTADTYSKYIHPRDRSARMVFSDGAAVTWLTASRRGTAGLIDVLCATQGRNYDAFYIPAGAFRRPRSKQTRLQQQDEYGNIRTDEHIQMDGMRIMEFITAKVPAQIKAILRRHRLGIKDIDLFIFHQASRFIINALAQELSIPAEKLFSNLSDVGNTVSASIPIALADARASGALKKGHRVVLSGFGVGLSWGTALMTF